MSAVRAIVAVDANWGIGKNNKLPWPHLAGDMKSFKELTTNQCIVMGRNTWESLPIQPLPNRRNIVISNNLKDARCFITSGTAEEIITRLRDFVTTDIWIIGGTQIYEQFLPFCDEVYLTRIKNLYKTDAKFPKDVLTTGFTLRGVSPTVVENDVRYQQEIWKRK